MRGRSTTSKSFVIRLCLCEISNYQLAVSNEGAGDRGRGSPADLDFKASQDVGAMINDKRLKIFVG